MYIFFEQKQNLIQLKRFFYKNLRVRCRKTLRKGKSSGFGNQQKIFNSIPNRGDKKKLTLKFHFNLYKNLLKNNIVLI